MIRGHIDRVSRERVEGWIALDGGELRGQSIQAVIGDSVVGQGSIDVFRQDLADAGIGDGWSGFSLVLQLESRHDPANVVMCLDGSCFCLLPARRVLKQSVDDALHSRMPFPLVSDLNWMRTRGWIDERLYNRLKILSVFGVIQERLAAPADPSPETRIANSIDLVRPVFDHLMRVPHQLVHFPLSGAAELHDLIDQARSSFEDLPFFFALSTGVEFPLSVVEASYFRAFELGQLAPEEIRRRGVEYELSERSVLTVNADSLFVPHPLANWRADVAVILPRRLR